MNAIFVLNHIRTRNEAFSCIFVSIFIAQNKLKNIISIFAIKYFWSVVGGETFHFFILGFILGMPSPLVLKLFNVVLLLPFILTNVSL